MSVSDPRHSSVRFKRSLVLALGGVVAAGIIVVVILLTRGSGEGSPGPTTAAAATTAVPAATTATTTAATATVPTEPSTTPASTAPEDTTTVTEAAGGCEPIEAVYATGPFTGYGDLARGLGQNIVGDRLVNTNFVDLNLPAAGGQAQGGFLLSLLGPGADDFAQYSGWFGPDAPDGEVVFDPAAAEATGTVKVVYSTDPAGGGTAEIVEIAARLDAAGGTVTGSIRHSAEELAFTLIAEPGVMFADPACLME